MLEGWLFWTLRPLAKCLAMFSQLILIVDWLSPLPSDLLWRIKEIKSMKIYWKNMLLVLLNYSVIKRLMFEKEQSSPLQLWVRITARESGHGLETVSSGKVFSWMPELMIVSSKSSIMDCARKPKTKERTWDLRVSVFYKFWPRRYLLSTMSSNKVWRLPFIASMMKTAMILNSKDSAWSEVFVKLNFLLSSDCKMIFWPKWTLKTAFLRNTKKEEKKGLKCTFEAYWNKFVK